MSAAGRIWTVDRRETPDPAGGTGWTIPGLAILGTIIAVWVFAL
jgi:hypothetical protein